MQTRVPISVWASLHSKLPKERRFLLLIPATGAATGLAAVGIAHVIAFIQARCWGSGHNLLDAALAMPWNYRILILALGGLVVGLIGRLFHTETRGAGTAGTIQALALKGGFISLRQQLPRVVCGILTVATGGSLGREGPMALLGDAMGSSIARRFGLTTPQVRVLTCASGAAAIAAVYNAPIGGSLLALEVLMGSFALEVFGPVVVASVISTLVFRSAMGDLPRFVIPAVLKDSYRLVSAWELVGYLALGVIAGIVSVLFVKSLFWTQDVFDKSRLPKWLQPAIGMTLVGIIGVWYPHVFGNGYEAVNLTLREELGPWQLLLLLAFLKLLATALTLGARGAGGLFMPTLMLGGVLGGAFGFGLHKWLPHHTADYGAYALVGMGGVLAGTTFAPITAIMMIFEQTNSYQIILPLMFVCIVSNVVARGFMSEPVHLQTLRRRGVILPRGPEESVMRSLLVRDVMHDNVVAVNQTAPFGEVVEHFLRQPHQNLYVADNDGRYLGAIRLHTLKGSLHQRETLGAVLAHDLVDEKFASVLPTARLADVMDKFWSEHAERLPVIDGAETRRLIGWISKRDLIGVYSQEILQKRQLLGRFSFQTSDGRRDVFVELPEGIRLTTLTVPPTFAGRSLGQLQLRSQYNLHVIQIRRRDPVTGTTTNFMPGADTKLQTDDELITIGPTEGVASLQLAMYSTVTDEDDEDDDTRQ